MSKIIEYLNKKYSNFTFTGKEITTIPQYQDAYEAIEKSTGGKFWLVCDEDNDRFLADTEFIQYKREIEAEIRRPVKVELTEDEIDRIEEILQHGI